jgi:hypothetical protein
MEGATTYKKQRSQNILGSSNLRHVNQNVYLFIKLDCFSCIMVYTAYCLRITLILKELC